MKKSTLKRIQKRINNLPSYFVDSSVFIEALFRQKRSGECRSFFHKAGLKYRIFTSTVVMGEVIKAINKLPSAEAKEEEMHLLADMLKSLDIVIMAVSFACINNVEAVRFSDSYLGSSDCIIFSSAVTENCNAFITLDIDFTDKLSKDFKMLIKNPENI
ncbi:MAG: type II toxin-antitoxin system VapC family toxin [Nanoarchaeota archaeon]|nr:type II toxin-antitoxin system VapC family toxin [Nanoarchaeota archaeon]